MTTEITSTLAIFW